MPVICRDSLLAVLDAKNVTRRRDRTIIRQEDRPKKRQKKMPKAIAVAVRRQIVERHSGGERLSSIARDLSMPYESLRKVWRYYRHTGQLAPNYQACGKRGVRASRRVYRAAVWLKRLHPTWGAALIGQVIQDKWETEIVPHKRSLQRWFVQAGVQAPKPKAEGQARVGRGTAAHNIWEMDSREAIQLARGEKVSWLVVSDEASGAVLGGTVFPPRPRHSA
jgi:transposase-like protein